jgi:hypothetical protein
MTPIQTIVYEDDRIKQVNELSVGGYQGTP